MGIIREMSDMYSVNLFIIQLTYNISGEFENN